MNPAFQLEAESVIAFVLITAAYLLLLVFATLTSKSNSLRLISMGLLTAIATMGYTGVMPLSNAVAPTMMKMAFLLVFAGVLIPFFTSLNTTASSTSSIQVEGDGHE